MNSGSNYAGGKGGSGIVIISYPTPSAPTTPPRPQILALPVSGTNLSLQVVTVSGFNYVLESATSLFPTPNWAPVSTNTGNGGTLTNIVTVNPGTPQRFYRYQVR